jgi:GntR family transcriptional regulator
MREENINDAVPAYKRIHSAIRRRIESGEIRPGAAVTSERELARIHKVSLMTARHALVSLEREGLVERRRGVGTFVSPPKIHFNKLMSYTELMASRGLLARSKIVYAGVVKADYEISARLSAPPTSPLTKIERVRLAADEPFALETFFLLANDFPGIANAPLERSSLFAALKNDYGVELAYADEEIDVTVTDVRTAELLAVPVGDPLLRISQVFYITKCKAVMYGTGLYLHGRHALAIRRFR